MKVIELPAHLLRGKTIRHVVIDATDLKVFGEGEQKNACKHRDPWMSKRNNRLLEILGLGGDKIAKSIWGKLSGYRKRVTVESAIARWKRLYGGHLKSRSPENQSFEVRIKAQILNKNLLVT